MIESSAKSQMFLQDLAGRCDVVEECYEFMLAYAAQGLSHDSGTTSGDQLRQLLGKAVVAIAGLPESYKTAIAQSGVEPTEKHEAFLAVLDRDCKSALSAMELVAAQPAISSMLIDNLNASVHIRTLLTDLFLLDELAKLQQAAGDQAASAER